MQLTNQRTDESLRLSFRGRRFDSGMHGNWKTHHRHGLERLDKARSVLRHDADDSLCPLLVDDFQ